jgi:hypothetical protein
VINDDVIVYRTLDGKDCVGLFGERWFKWPAVQHGWQSRQGCPTKLAEVCEELDPKHASLALRLSGVEIDG